MPIESRHRCFGEDALVDDGRHFRLDNLLFVDFSAHTEAALLFFNVLSL